MRQPSRWVLAAALSSLCPSVPIANAGPITLNTALPVAEGQVFAKQTVAWQRLRAETGSRDLRLDRLTATTVMGYGVTARLAVLLALPVRFSQLTEEKPIGTSKRRAFGLGDVRVIGRFTAYRQDGPGRTFRIAPFAGLRFPSGRNEVRDAAGLLPPAMQPGSGPLAPIVGAVVTYQTLDFEVDAQVSYLRSVAGTGFDTGDVLRLDLSFQYRLSASQLQGPNPAFLYGVLELGYRRSTRPRFDGTPLTTEGREDLTLTLGLQYVRVGWLVEAAVQVPLAHDSPNGGLKPDFGVLVGFRYNF